jgi:hypothetical protein
MKTKLLLLFTILFLVILTSSSASNATDKLILKFGYQHYPWMGDIIPFSNKQLTSTGYCEANYCFHKLFSLGATLGFGVYEWADLSSLGSSSSSISSDLFEKKMKPMLLYGINANFKILPLFIKKDDFFLDLYVSTKLGGIYLNNRNKQLDEKRELIDYGIYGGIAVYPFKKLGFYYEYGYGNYIKWRTGLCLRF